MTTTTTNSLNLIDLNDYLGPSQLCTKPNIPTQQPQAPISNTQIQLDDHQLVTAPLPKAQITLNDCLACSGCITSSESILVSLQSVQEVLKELQKPNRYPILSISSHSLASFAAYNQLDSISTAFKVLRKYFIQTHKFALVLDTSFSQRLHLLESQREFKNRRQDKVGGSGKTAPLLASSCPAWICYAEKTQGKNGILEMISRVKSAQQIQGALLKSPRFAASVGLSSVEQIYHVCVMSCYDKKLEASRSDFVSEEGIKDVDCVLTTREVQDMIEQDGFDILQAAQEPAPSEPSLVVENHTNQVGIPIWIHHNPPVGSSSGGYLFNLLRASIPSHDDDGGEDIIDRLKLTVDRKRGSDYVEYRLQLVHSPPHQGHNNSPDEPTEHMETLFYGALFYGFKNLQNLIRKIAPPSAASTRPRARIGMGRRRKEEGGEGGQQSYDFVEVMACPSGCVNGGGQIPPGASSAGPTSKQWIAKLDQVYFNSESSPSGASDGHVQSPDQQLTSTASVHDDPARLPHTLRAAHQLDLHERAFIQSWLKAWGFLSDQAYRDRTFLTSYRAVEPESNGFAVQW